MWHADSSPSGAVGPHYLVHYKGWKQTYVLSRACHGDSCNGALTLSRG